MKNLIKIVMSLWIFIGVISTPVLANIDESKVDLYYANGIGMELEEAIAEAIWRESVEALKKANPKEFKNVNAKISYNSSTLYGAEDFMESLLQWFDQSPKIGLNVSWSLAKQFYSTYLESILGKPIELSQALNFVDLNNHIVAYEQSIENGHGVVVVAHSQGNFFTNKAYDSLDPWMQSYFKMIGVASPANSVAGDGFRISFDNDPVGLLSLTFDSIENPNRSETILGNFDFHSFAYYMGEPVPQSNPPISTNVARILIENAILAGVTAHESASSQWKKVNDVGCLCSEKRITIAHKFDSNLDSLMAGQAVYEFNEDAKVYPVSGEHVFAQLGGAILESGGTGDTCYLLKDETQVVLGEISGGNSISITQRPFYRTVKLESA